MPSMKIALLAGVATALLSIAPAMFSRAQAQADYPSKPVRIIVPSSPGGGTDTVARLLGQYLSENLGQQFVIENRPGAGSATGIEAGARATPDGYTLVMVASTMTSLHVTRKAMRFDAAKVRRSAFSVHELTAQNSADSIETLFIVDGQRQVVASLFFFFRHDRGGEHNGATGFHDT